MLSNINPRKGGKTKDPIEKRRANGEISCAECRRQKLKCDKAVPCGTCKRKGCESICPNGTLAPVHIPRLAPGDTDMQMHKLIQMSKRVRQLEDALQIAHSSVPGGSTHPLLSDELLKVKNIAKAVPPVKNESDSSDEETIDTVGTLVNMGRGMESYLGATELAIGHFEPIHFKGHPQDTPIRQPSATFPFRPLYLPAEEVQAQIEANLPSYERGSSLVEAYLENVSWLVKIVDREQIMDELMPQIYCRKSPLHGATVDETRRIHPHTLSLLLAVFALGAVADMTLPPWNEEADLYYHLSWTAMGLESLFNGTNFHTIQALAVIGSYDLFSCRKRSLESSWKIVNFCVSLAASIGLHRDPTHFKLSSKQVQRRRRLLWELQAMDIWKSVGTGRPMSLYPAVVDCELPEDTEAVITKDGVKLPSIWRVRYIYSKDIMASLVDKLASVKPLKYSDVLLVDQKIREFDLDNFIATNASISVDQHSGPGIPLMLLLKDASLLLLHRNFFVRAIIESPEDPARSRFGPSFLSAYRSGVTMLRTMRGLMDNRPHIISRVWPFWAHAISASVLLGSIAACGSLCSLAPQAFVEFNDAISMFEKTQSHPLIIELMPIVLQLRDRAYEALVRRSNEALGPHAVPNLGLLDNAQGIGSYEKMGQTSPSSTVPPSGSQGSVNPRAAFPQHHPWTSSSSSSSNSSFVDPNQEGSVGGGLLHPPAQPTFVTSPSGASPSCQQPSQGSTRFGNTQGIAVPVPFYMSPEMQVESGRSGIPETSSKVPNRQSGGQIAGVHQHSSPGSDHWSGSEDYNRLHLSPHVGQESCALGQGSGAQQIQTPLDPQSSFSYDQLSSLPLESFFNTDFDISSDMFGAVGNESVLPHISDDLEACRTILTDSRFFGYGASATGTPTYTGQL